MTMLKNPNKLFLSSSLAIGFAYDNEGALRFFKKTMKDYRARPRSLSMSSSEGFLTMNP